MKSTTFFDFYNLAPLTIFTKLPVYSRKSQMLPSWAPSRAILTDCLVRCGQRVGVGFTPAHGEDVHGFNVNNELWSRTLQACKESRQQVQTGFTKKDTEEGGKVQGTPEMEEDIPLNVKHKADSILQQIQMPEI